MLLAGEKKLSRVVAMTNSNATRAFGHVISHLASLGRRLESIDGDDLLELIELYDDKRVLEHSISRRQTSKQQARVFQSPLKSLEQVPVFTSELVFCVDNFDIQNLVELNTSDIDIQTARLTALVKVEVFSTVTVRNCGIEY